MYFAVSPVDAKAIDEKTCIPRDRFPFEYVPLAETSIGAIKKAMDAKVKTDHVMKALLKPSEWPVFHR